MNSRLNLTVTLAARSRCDLDAASGSPFFRRDIHKNYLDRNSAILLTSALAKPRRQLLHHKLLEQILNGPGNRP